MEVKFTRLKSFLEDLAVWAGRKVVVDDVLRMVLVTVSGPLPVRTFEVRASFAIPSSVIKLAVAVGDDLGPEGHKEEAVKRGEALMAELRAKAEELGLTVLGGEYFMEAREGGG